MKKVLKLCSLSFIGLFICLNNVKADIKIDSYSNAGYFGNEVVLNAKLNVDGTSTTAYCHNPGVLAFTQQDATNKITLGHVTPLGDTKDGRSKNIHDAGIMSILTNNNSDNGNANFTMAKYIAINLYDQLFPMFNSNANNGSSEIPYLKYIINNNYNDIKGDLKTLANYMGSYNVISGTMSGASNCSGSNCGSTADINAAVSMVKTALKTAINYAKNGEATATIGNAIQVRSQNTDDSGKTVYKNTATHTIVIASFGNPDGNPRSVYLNFNCANCTNVTPKFYLNDNEVADISRVNLLDYTNNGSGNVKLKIEFSGNTCQDINYTLSATYTHYTVSRRGYNVAKCNNSTKCQGFYVADSSSSTGTKTTTIENKINLCQTTGEVSQCTAKIDNVECVECKANTHEINVVEGYTYPNDNTCDTSGATLNIKKCIANDGAVDTANHTYKNSELSEDTKSHNAGVYCKEDYKLSMPGSIMVDSGRYFTLNASIRGTEKCYTNDLLGSKSLASVKAQITEHGNATVEAYNEIQKYKAIVECLDNSEDCLDISKEKTDPTPCDTRYVVYNMFRSSFRSDEEWENRCKALGATMHYPADETAYCSYRRAVYLYKYRVVADYEVSYQLSSCDGGGTASARERIYEGVEHVCGADQSCAGRRCSDYAPNSEVRGATEAEINSVTEISSSERDEALAAIGKKASGHWVASGGAGSKVPSGGSWQGESGSGLSVQLGTGSIISDINGWNSATGYYAGIIDNDFNDNPFANGWKMNYNFDPSMNFWYQENYMNQARTDQMDMYDKSLSDVKAQYCDGEVRDDYSCTTGWKDVPSVESGSVCVCWGPEAGDCGNKNYVLSKVRYVMQSQDAEAKFITPTQFYTIAPSGSIVVAEAGKRDEIKNSSELTNGLPVGLGTNGTRRYVLWVEKLGEYFDADKLGRVWGASDSVMAKLLLDRTKCNNSNSALVAEDNTQGVVHDEGVYACKYSTDCPNTDNNGCQTPSESPDGNYHCQDGEPCDEDQYNKECKNPSDNGCQTPSESTDNKYHCQDGEPCEEDQYNKECKNPSDNGCQTPSESTDNKYHCQDGEPCEEDQYNNECKNPSGDSCKTPSESKDGKWHCKTTPDEQCDEAKYKQECCPNGKCPTSVVYKCAVTTNEKGETLYYDKDGNKTDEATYKSQCCPNGECPVTCTFCLYDDNKLNVQFRPITSEDLNPNDRDLGKNWSWDDNINSAIELKAYVTTQEIQEKGDSIYDISEDSFNNPSADNEYAVRIKMDGKMISKTRTYNREHSAEGFVNNTSDCYDLIDGEKVYENAFCYSTFIDYIQSEMPNNIQFTRIRPLGNERKDTANNEKYFTSWIHANSSAWNVNTTREIAYYKEHYGMELNPSTGKVIDYHVGVSWK